MKKKNKFIIFALITTLIVGCIIGSSSMIFPAVTPVGGPVIDNSDDNVKINTSGNLPDSDYKIITYTFEVGSLTNNGDDGSIEMGTVVTTDDYVYVYGYYWNSPTLVATETEDDKSLIVSGGAPNWIKMTSNIGWGVAVKDRSKYSYADIYAKINGKPITYITNCFANCENLLSAPILPNFAVNSDNCFLNCKNLLDVTLPREGTPSEIMNTIGKNMFDGCKELINLYIPATITRVNADGDKPFDGCNKLQLYVEKGSGYTGSWNSGANGGTPKYNQTIRDYLMATNSN